MQKLPIGVDDFKELATEGYLFVDHTMMIKEFLEGDDKISLILRPRRWGKSLTLSMLYYFLSINAQGAEDIFDNLAIAKFDGGAFVKKYRGQYPVILFSLKGVKNNTFEGFLGDMAVHIRSLYGMHYYLLSSDKLSAIEKDEFRAYLTVAYEDEPMLALSLSKLSKFLSLHFEKQVYILIDEYDVPMSFVYKDVAALDNTADFLRKMLGDALKGNPCLDKGLMTGILRLSKNHMLSDLNNLKVYAALDEKYSQYYGFLEEEVDDLFMRRGLIKDAAKIKHWYNGYYSGSRVVYNPWSIINCLAANGHMRPYWVLTAGDDLIRECFVKSAVAVKAKFLQLLEGGKIDAVLGQTVKFTEVVNSEDEDHLWTLLFYAGYLKATDVEDADLDYKCKLEIPNEEVMCVYRSIFSKWLVGKIGNDPYNALLSNLARGDVRQFVVELNRFLMSATSFRDFTDENSYHCFVLGLISGMMHTHQIESNKEYGSGLLDVSLTPLDKNKHLGVILEFKYLKPKHDLVMLKKTAETGLEQIKTRAYRKVFAAPNKEHVHEVIEIGLAFLGKSVAAAYQKINLADGQVMEPGFEQTSGLEDD